MMYVCENYLIYSYLLKIGNTFTWFKNQNSIKCITGKCLASPSYPDGPYSQSSFSPLLLGVTY